MTLTTTTTPKCTGSTPSAKRRGHQDRHEDQQDGRSLEHAAEDQQQDVGEQQEHRRRELGRLQRRGQRLGDVLHRDDVVEHHRAGDQHADRGGDPRAAEQRVVGVAQSHRAVQEAPRRRASTSPRPPPPRSAWSRRCTGRPAGSPASAAPERSPASGAAARAAAPAARPGNCGASRLSRSAASARCRSSAPGMMPASSR